MKKRSSLIFAILAILACIGISISVSRIITDNRASTQSTQRHEDFYDMMSKKARTKKMKSELGLLRERNPGVEYRLREAKMIIGELPKNKRRLTLDEARNIAEKYQNDYNSIIEEFNKICGAPDVFGGSGMNYVRYFLDDIGDEYILCFYVGTDGTGLFYEPFYYWLKETTDGNVKSFNSEPLYKIPGFTPKQTTKPNTLN